MNTRDRIERIRHQLTDWYRRCARQLPWRQRSDPYAIWVSEVMLQQTRVDTVTDYYRRFLDRFPTVQALADAPADAVMKAWEGMGYYTRARNLHHAARIVAYDHDGQLPASVEGLGKLPGVGPYTAGAIASIAFGLDEPVLDGNVVRVLTRVFGIAEPVKAATTQSRLWDLARDLIPPGQAGLFNQAVMDLGATTCTPRQPRCPQCPIADACAARAAGTQEQLPVKAPARKTPHCDVVVGVIRRRGRILVDRRPAKGLLGGLWEFPGGKIEPGETHAQALRREIREEVGLDVTVGEKIATVKHAYSHFRITMHAYACQAPSGKARALACDAIKWIWPKQLAEHAFPRANRKVIEKLQAPHNVG